MPISFSNFSTTPGDFYIGGNLFQRSDMKFFSFKIYSMPFPPTEIGFPFIGGGIVKSIVKHHLYNKESIQSIELDKEYQLSYIRTSTELVKRNQYIQDDTVYIFGGYSGDKLLKKYQLNKSIMEFIEYSNTVFGSNTTCLYDGDRFIYLLGVTMQGIDTLSRIMRFDISTDQLDTEYSDLLAPRFCSSGCFDGKGNIYLWGGTKKEKGLYTYNYYIEKFNITNKKSEIIFEIDKNEINTSLFSILFHENQLYFSNGPMLYRYNLLSNQVSKFNFTSNISKIFYFEPKNQLIAINLDIFKGQSNIYVEDLSTLEIDKRDLFKLEYTISIPTSTIQPSICFFLK
eukprot:gene4828-6017_t